MGNSSAGALRLIVAGLAVATIIGLIAMWPGEGEADLAQGLSAASEGAVVVAVATEPCPPPQPGNCSEARATLSEGPDSGTEVTLPITAGPLAPQLSPGDEIRVSRVEAARGSPEAATYNFVDFERRGPILWLALAFAALVIAFGRLRGALSLLGLAVSLAIVVIFIVPAILEGTAPLAVAIVGALAVMLVTIPLAHGIGPKALAAMLGTSASLLLVAILALVFTELAHLTGLAAEESTLMQLGTLDVSFQGLLLAGMVIAALGVLDDVTVSQASIVLALRRAQPTAGFRAIYREAIDVGRDHVSATVNTLVLAYVGASLPVLLVFGSAQLGFTEAVNLEIVAQEVVATLVGSIGLIAAVPITTALAARLAPVSAADESSDEHAHHH